MRILNFFSHILMKNFYITNNYSTFFSFQSSESLFKMEYLSILIYLFVAIALSIIILVLSYLLAVQNPETEKMSAYECGFEPLSRCTRKV